MTSGGESEDRDLVRLDLPFRGMSAHDLDCTQCILLRSGKTIRRNTVFHHKRMKSLRVETLRDRSRFVTRTVGISASGQNDHAAAHFIARQQIRSHVRLKITCSIRRDLAVAPKHHFFFKLHFYLKSW